MKMKILFTQKKEGKKDNPELIGDYLSRIYKVKGDKVPPRISLRERNPRYPLL